MLQITIHDVETLLVSFVLFYFIGEK